MEGPGILGTEGEEQKGFGEEGGRGQGTPRHFAPGWGKTFHSFSPGMFFILFYYYYF